MKKMLFSIAAVFLFGFAVKAQDPGYMESQDISKNEVPGQVMENFNEQFASAKGVDWEKRGDMYSAEFELNKEDKEVYFDNSGKVNIVKTKINEAQLPSEVRDALSSQYAGYKTDDFSKIEKEGKTTYKVEAKKDGQESHLIFDESGKVNIVKTEIEEAQLPSGVRDALSSQYAGYKTDDFSKIEKEGKTTYKLEAKKDGQESYLIFDESGKLITEKKKDMKKKDKKM